MKGTVVIVTPGGRMERDIEGEVEDVIRQMLALAIAVPREATWMVGESHKPRG